jgi:hypothetical protein
MQKNSSLVTLYLDHNRFSDQGCVALAGALRYNRTLRALSLAGNFVEENGIEPICQIVRMNILETLDISDMLISDDECEILVLSLLMNSSLKRLNLFRNSITSSGCPVWLCFLESNQNMRELLLGNEGCALLMKSLTTHKSLEKLIISMNGITSGGCLPISELIKQNRALMWDAN